MFKKIVAVITSLALLITQTAGAYATVYNYTYDQNGNVTSDGTQCYEYNDSNQLKSVKNCITNELIEEYLYDFNGKRVVKKEYSGGALVRTVYSPSDEQETVVESEGPTTNSTYYKINGEMVAKKDSAGTKTYFHNDHLNSASVVTDENGELLEETSYLPYGAVAAGGLLSKYLFTGQENDEKTGLYYYGARFYNATLGRFIQPDSILPDLHDPQQLNRFAYARNNPVKYIDPSGNFIVELGEAMADAFILGVWNTISKHGPGDPLYNEDLYNQAQYNVGLVPLPYTLPAYIYQTGGLLLKDAQRFGEYVDNASKFLAGSESSANIYGTRLHSLLEDTYKLDPYFNLAYQSNLKMSPGNSGLDLVSKLGLGSLDPTTANFSAKHFTRANGSQNLITILYEMNKGLVGYEVGSNVFNAKQFRLPTWLLALGNSKFINSDNNFCEANYCGQ